MDGSSFSWLFIVVASLITLVPLAVMVKIIGQLYWVGRVLKVGHRAEGRCVRVYTTYSARGMAGIPGRTSGMSSSSPHGREVRFGDDSVPSTTHEGDHVMVAYVPERPERAVVTRNGHRPPYVRSAAVLVFWAVFIVAVIGIGVSGFNMANSG
jgi:hypothetical protein